MRRMRPQSVRPGKRRPVRLAPALVLAAGLAAMPGGAPPAQETGGATVETLEKRAEQDRRRARDLKRKAADLARELKSLRKRSVKLADKTRKLENRLDRVESRLADLTNTRRTLKTRLGRRREQLEHTLAALQRIALRPPEALAVSDKSPLAVARAASLLDTAVPALEERAATLRDNLRQLDALSARIATEKTRLQNTKRKLAAKREDLKALMARKKRLIKRTRAASRKARRSARKLAAEARDMRELVTALKERGPLRPSPAPVPGRKPVDALQTARQGSGTAGGGGNTAGSAATETGTTETAAAGDGPASTRTATRPGALTRPADIRPFPDSKRSLRRPVAGKRVAGFGDTIERRGTQRTAKGVVIRASPGASVVAPFDGKVVYAGPFKSYGRILILQHGDQYHSLLAGLDRIDAIVGQWVLAGEPVGAMGETADDPPKLYVELRRGGKPIDPAPWLARRGKKVRG